MGHIPLEMYEQMYKSIRKQCAPPSRGAVLVFVSPDTDSLCACKILLVCFLLLLIQQDLV